MQFPLGRRFWEYRWLAATLAVAAIGIGLRATALGQGYWFDEVVSAATARLPLPDLLFRSAFYDSHSPLYYMLLSAWTGLFGAGEWAGRMLSLVFAMLTLLLVGTWGRSRGAWAAFIAVLLLAFSTFHIHYSVEVRGYSLAAFLVTAYFMLMERIERDADMGLARWVLLGLVQCLMVFSSGFTLPLVVAANLHFFSARRRALRRLWRWCLVQAWSVAVCSTWLPVLMVQWFQFPGEPDSLPSTAMASVDFLMYLGISTVHPSIVVAWLGALLPLFFAGLAAVCSFRRERYPGEEQEGVSMPSLTATAGLQIAAAMLASLLGPVVSVLALPTTESTLPLLVSELTRTYFFVIGALFLLVVGPMVNRHVLVRGHGAAFTPFVLGVGVLLLGLVFALHKPFPPRQALFLVPPLFALAATAWHPAGMLSKTALCALILALSGPSLFERDKAFEPRQDLRAAAAFVSARVPFAGQEQPVFVIPMWDRPALEYYLGEDRAEGIMVPQRISQAAQTAERVTLVLTREAFNQRKAFRDSATRLLGPRFQLKDSGVFRGVSVVYFVRLPGKGANP